MDATLDGVALQPATEEHFLRALARDQDAALIPDATTPFESAADAASRLLPYHVFSAAELRQTPDTPDTLDASSTPPHTPTRIRKRKGSYPLFHQTIALWSRYASVGERYCHAHVHFDGGTTRAQASGSMQLQLAHLAVEQERECLAREAAQLSARRAEYESWVRSNPRLRPTYPAPPPLKTTYLPLASSTVANPSPLAEGVAPISSTPKPPTGKKRGRKSKAEMATALSEAAAAHGANQTTAPPGQLVSTPPVEAGQGPFSFRLGRGANMASATGTNPTVPSLVQIPLAWLTRLTQAGINPAPAPHLVPALSASGTQGGVRVGPDTAPRPPPMDQKEPAVLVGMTQAVPPNAPSSPPVQILHIAFRWDKLSPPQLTTVIGLLSSIQQASTPALRGSAGQSLPASQAGTSAPPAT